MSYVYMLASQPNGTLYVGHTDDLIARMHQHREKVLPGFTSKYGVSLLVWYEGHEDRASAFHRERQIKKWYRAWKLRTIEAANSQWRDLYEDFFTAPTPLHPDLAFLVEGNSKTSLDPRMRGDERKIDG